MLQRDKQSGLKHASALNRPQGATGESQAGALMCEESLACQKLRRGGGGAAAALPSPPAARPPPTPAAPAPAAASASSLGDPVLEEEGWAAPRAAAASPAPAAVMADSKADAKAARTLGSCNERRSNGQYLSLVGWLMGSQHASVRARSDTRCSDPSGRRVNTPRASGSDLERRTESSTADQRTIRKSINGP